MDLTKRDLKAKNFRMFLQQELVERCRKNPKYSLRAFAKSLDIGPAALSDMLNGKRSITVKTVERLGLALGLTLTDIKRYNNESSNPELSDSNQTPAHHSASSTRYQQITLDAFAVISDWYHYAILELMKVRAFRPDPAWIARSLGVTKSEVNIAIERLVRLGLIEIDEKGRWQDLSAGFSTNIIDSSLTTAGAKKLQKQILEMSLKALDEISPQERNHTSMTMAVDPKYLPEAIEKIKEFRRGLCEFLEKKGRPQRVYQLAVSLFPVHPNHYIKGDF